MATRSVETLDAGSVAGDLDVGVDAIVSRSAEADGSRNNELVRE